MAFNAGVKKLVVRDKKTGKYLPCVMCGKAYPLPDAVHIIDEEEWKKKNGHDSKINGIPLCPNCHRIFDEVFRPYLYRALKEFGCTNLPESWSRNNKIMVTDSHLDIQDPQEGEC